MKSFRSLIWRPTLNDEKDTWNFSSDEFEFFERIKNYYISFYSICELILIPQKWKF